MEVWHWREIILNVWICWLLIILVGERSEPENFVKMYILCANFLN